MIGGRTLLVLVLLGWPGGLVAEETSPPGEFRLSPPAEAPAERPQEALVTNLRDLTDARGLAELLSDDKAVAVLGELVQAQEKVFSQVLSSDPVLNEIDARLASGFAENLADRTRAPGELAALVASLPRQRLQPLLKGWLQSLFYSRQVMFPEDLEKLGQAELDDICLQARALDTLQGMPSWRYRTLVWRYRDTEVKRLFTSRDERLRFLTPVRLPVKEFDPSKLAQVRRALDMLRNLRLQVVYNRYMPYETYRALEGLLRGLRYMDTIRAACEVTGLDLRLMTRLFTQESEFIHQRVSAVGAYSVAQLMDIALKDVWLFRSSITGSVELLKGIKSVEELKQAVIADPRMAIKVACLYFRRIRDEVAHRLEKDGQEGNARLATMLTLELYALERGTGRTSAFDTRQEILRIWPVEGMMPLVLVPVAGGIVPDPGSAFARWLDRTIQDLVGVRISEEVFKGRLSRLEDALGLAAYNAGMGNLARTAKRQGALASLGFPIQLAETRDYVDGILNGVAVLEETEQLVSEVSRLSYEDLKQLANRACEKAGRKKKQEAPKDLSTEGKAAPPLPKAAAQK